MKDFLSSVKGFVIGVSICVAIAVALLVLYGDGGRQKGPNAWIIGWTNSMVAEQIGGSSTPTFSSSSVRQQSNSDIWFVSGQVALRDDGGAVSQKPYQAAVRQVCDTRSSRECWKLEGLSVGERVVMGDPSILPAGPKAPPSGSQVTVPIAQAPEADRPDTDRKSETPPKAPAEAPTAAPAPAPDSQPEQRAAEATPPVPAPDKLPNAETDSARTAEKPAEKPRAGQESSDKKASEQQAAEQKAQAPQPLQLPQVPQPAEPKKQASEQQRTEQRSETQATLQLPLIEQPSDKKTPAADDTRPSPNAPAETPPKPDDQPGNRIAEAPSADRKPAPPSPSKPAKKEPPKEQASTGPDKAPPPPAKEAPETPAKPAGESAQPQAKPKDSGETEIAKAPTTDVPTETSRPSNAPARTTPSADKAAGEAAGPSDSVVFLIQNRLRDLGLDPGRSDGRMGPKTEAAIKTFQSRQGLPVNGRPTRELLDAMERQLLAFAPASGTSTDAAKPRTGAQPQPQPQPQPQRRPQADTPSPTPPPQAGTSSQVQTQAPLDHASGSGPSLFRVAMQAAAAGQYSAAIENYTRAIQAGLTEENMAAAYSNRGLVHYERGNYDQAIADYDAAIRIRTDFAAAYANRGLAYFRQGLYDRAIDNYDTAIRLRSDFATAYANRGLAYFRKGEYDQALRDYDTALQLNPNLDSVRLDRALAYEAKMGASPRASR